jgi:hypothetical protein
MSQDLGLRRLRIDLYDAGQASQTLLSSALAESAVRNVAVLPVVIPNFQGYPDGNAAQKDCRTLMETYAGNFKQVAGARQSSSWPLSQGWGR